MALRNGRLRPKKNEGGWGGELSKMRKLNPDRNLSRRRESPEHFNSTARECQASVIRKKIENRGRYVLFSMV